MSSIKVTNVRECRVHDCVSTLLCILFLESLQSAINAVCLLESSGSELLKSLLSFDLG